MMRTLVLWLGLLLLPVSVFAEGRIAIFDYDRRSTAEPGVAPYLEQQLKAFDPALTVISLSAEGDQDQAIELLDRLDRERWDLVITITTDALQLALHRLRSTPFVFTNVNDPKAFGISDRDDSERRFTGASYYVSAREQLEFFLKIQPGIRRLGFLFDPSNRSMQVEAQEVRQACQELGIEFIYRRVSADTPLGRMAAELAAEGVEAIVATNSDRIYLHVAEIERGLGVHPLPIYSFNARGVENGALAALASDHWEMIDKLVMPRVQAIVSEGKSPSELAIGYLATPRRYLNDAALARFGLTRPAP